MVRRLRTYSPVQELGEAIALGMTCFRLDPGQGVRVWPVTTSTLLPLQPAFWPYLGRARCRRFQLE